MLQISYWGAYINDLYLPQSKPDTPLPTYASPTTPLPVTQLPTPVILTPTTPPTPLLATPAPITALRTVTGSVELAWYQPLAQHMLYSTEGGYYSQPLSGGPAIRLGGTDSECCSVLRVAPDERDALIQTHDGIYRVSLDSGARTQLTAPFPPALIVDPSTVRLSEDGRFAPYHVPIATTTSPGQQPQRDPPKIVIAIYSVPLSGGPPVRLTPPGTNYHYHLQRCALA